MARKIYLDYTIHLPVQADVTELQQARTRYNIPRNDINGTLKTQSFLGIPLGGNGQLICSPQRAANEFGAALVTVGSTKPASPYITSNYIRPVASPDRYPTDEDSFVRGWFQAREFGSGTKRFIWRGKYAYQPNGPDDVDFPPGAPQAIRQRRWIDGFELPSVGEGPAAGDNTFSEYVSRAASRHPDGLGLSINEPIANVRSHNHNEFRPGLSVASGWERLYIRLISAPTAEAPFWHCKSAAGSLTGVEMRMLPSRQIAVYNVTNAGVRNLMGAASDVLELGKWYRVDVLYQCGTGADFQLYLGRVLRLNISAFPTNVGWSTVAAAAAQTSSIGDVLGVGNTGICMHVDDWIGADRPSVLANELGVDWLNGSRVVPLHAHAFGAVHQAANWGATKPVEQLRARNAVDLLTTLDFSSTTAGSIFETNHQSAIAQRVLSEPKAINNGVCAIIGSWLQSGPTAIAGGTQSYAINGGAYVDAVQPATSTTMNWDSVGYMPSGLALPQSISALTLKYVTGAGVSARAVRGCMAVAEILGVFDEADVPPTGDELDPPAPSVGPHNSPYERSEWAFNTGVAPISPVIIKAGKYVGNGTKTTLTFRAPVAFLWVRRVTATETSGPIWWSSQFAGRVGFDFPYSPEAVVSADYVTVGVDPGSGEQVAEAECRIDMVGTGAANNENGVTYQYLAFMDPGMRFSMAAGIRHHRGPGDRATPLFKPTFLGQLGLFHRRTVGGTTNVSTYLKGRGHTDDTINILNGAAIASALNFTAGFVNSKTAFHPSAAAAGEQENSFILFRNDDGSEDPGIPNTLHVLTYTGDGNASRSINLPGTTKRPVLAIISGRTGTTIFRDVSHTGTTSSQIGTGVSLSAIASTGITGGGPGQVNVGSVLNANGVVYEVLVFMGDECTGGNNGWGCDGEFEPVDPDSPDDWPDEDDDPFDDEDDEDEDSDDDDDDGGGGGGGGDGGGEEPGGGDFEGQCVPASTRVCNQALANLGVSQPIVDLVNDATPEAALCRLHYADAVNEALRAFPWPFATRYATLVHAAGTEDNPVNGDWIRTFRMPADLLFARRLVNPELGRTFDPDPPPFRQGGADATSRLLFTNYLPPDATDDDPAVELEYTYRPNCAASQGDALFRSALQWLLSHKLAPALSRNKVKAADCWAMFLFTLSQAQVVAAREHEPERQDPDAPWVRGR